MKKFQLFYSLYSLGQIYKIPIWEGSRVLYQLHWDFESTARLHYRRRVFVLRVSNALYARLI